MFNYDYQERDNIQLFQRMVLFLLPIKFEGCSSSKLQASHRVKMHLFQSNVVLLLLITLLVLFQIVFTASILTQCRYESGNYTSGSQFESNLKNLLLPSLISKDYFTGFFFNTTSGKDPDTVYGLVQCRYDVSSSNCKDCLNTASIEILKSCPSFKDAVIRYDKCLLRYSNLRFFSEMEWGLRVTISSNRNASDQILYNQQVGNLMENLRSKAIYDPYRFAQGSTRFRDYNNIYGYVQCTQDISSDDCFTCLQYVMDQILNCCSGKSGGRTSCVSCYLQFGDSPVTELSLPSPPPRSPPPPPLGNTKGSSSSPNLVVIVGPIIAVGVATLLLAFCVYFLRRKSRRKAKSGIVVDGDEIIATAESLRFDLATIRDATDNFSDANKLGEGGFGAVYKGKLPDGKYIAAKRLSSNCGQGSQEFKNEVVLLHGLRHRNLVKLWGYCFEAGKETILIYEFVLNKSLDNYLFDPLKKMDLDWHNRYKVIRGIARGLVYLHEDAPLRIVHRDLKAGNILLDEEMDAKIADFGMAKLFELDQTYGNTSRIAGTFGYMAPEYASHGLFSLKSDVYSFGVLLLEIVSGKRVTSFYQSSPAQDLLSYAWKHWKEGTILELMDPTLNESFSRNEVMKSIHIGLLCVQERTEDRPNMSSVVLMLNSNSITMVSPSQPHALKSGPNLNMAIIEEESQSLIHQLAVQQLTLQTHCPMSL